MLRTHPTTSAYGHRQHDQQRRESLLCRHLHAVVGEHGQAAEDGHQHRRHLLDRADGVVGAVEEVGDAAHLGRGEGSRASTRRTRTRPGCAGSTAAPPARRPPGTPSSTTRPSLSRDQHQHEGEEQPRHQRGMEPAGWRGGGRRGRGSSRAAPGRGAGRRIRRAARRHARGVSLRLSDCGSASPTTGVEDAPTSRCRRPA